MDAGRHGALPSHMGREEEKSRKLPQVGEGTAHIRLFCEQGPGELHPALGHPDAAPACQDSSARLWMQGQGFPSLFAERKYGRLWGFYLLFC